MKEELIKYVMEKADECNSCDFPIIEIETWIREFFDQIDTKYSPNIIYKPIENAPDLERATSWIPTPCLNYVKITRTEPKIRSPDWEVNLLEWKDKHATDRAHNPL